MQDLASPLAERTKPQVSGPEDQHKDEGPEMGDQEAKRERSQILTWFSGAPGVGLSLEASLFFFFLPFPFRPRPFFFPLPLRRGVVVSGSSLGT